MNGAGAAAGDGGGGSGSGSGSRGHRARRSRANTATRAREGRSGVAAKVREGVKKKLGFYTDMMGQLDMVVFAELCVLYYMDCSFFRFAARAVPHSFFLSPKAEDFVIALDARRPHVFAIFVPNFLCLLAHSLGALPAAAEAQRGYLHGGVVIDFVGQKAPSSALALVALDLFVLAVQCLMLAMHAEREKLRRLVSPVRAAVAATAVARAGGSPAPAAAAAATAQELDAMERGDAADAPATGTPDEDERLHNIDLAGPSGAAASPEAAAEQVLDALSAGANVGDFYVVHAIRQAMQEKTGPTAAAASLQSIGYAYTLARLAAERRTRARAATAR